MLQADGKLVVGIRTTGSKDTTPWSCDS
jgi:hypothetical protein